MENWEKDNWCVSIIAEAMTFARTHDIGDDASHITEKLRIKISALISEAESRHNDGCQRRVFYQKLYRAGYNDGKKDIFNYLNRS